MVLVVMSVKLTIPYLRAETLGVWMTLTSLTAMLAFLDLGIGNALTNRVARAAAQDQPRALQQVITGGLLTLAAIGAVAAAMLCLVAAVLPWGWLIHTDNAALVAETTIAALVFARQRSPGHQPLHQRRTEGLSRPSRSEIVRVAPLCRRCDDIDHRRPHHRRAPASRCAGVACHRGSRPDGRGAAAACAPVLARPARRHRCVAAMREEFPVLMRTGSMFLALQPSARWSDGAPTASSSRLRSAAHRWRPMPSSSDCSSLQARRWPSSTNLCGARMLTRMRG